MNRLPTFLRSERQEENFCGAPRGRSTGVALSVFAGSDCASFPALANRKVKRSRTAMSFDFPEYFDFRPFFTLQKGETRENFLELWTRLLVDWSVANNVKFISIETENLTEPPFGNPKISRKLSKDTLKAILEHMVEVGNGEWVRGLEGEKMRIMKTSAKSLARNLYKLAQEKGMINEIYTLYEMTDEEFSKFRGTEFVGMDEELLEKIIRVLESQGLAKIFKTKTGTGIKFLKGTDDN